MFRHSTSFATRHVAFKIFTVTGNLKTARFEVHSVKRKLEPWQSVTVPLARPSVAARAPARALPAAAALAASVHSTSFATSSRPRPGIRKSQDI